MRLITRKTNHVIRGVNFQSNNSTFGEGRATEDGVQSPMSND